MIEIVWQPEQFGAPVVDDVDAGCYNWMFVRIHDAVYGFYTRDHEIRYYRALILEQSMTGEVTCSDWDPDEHVLTTSATPIQMLQYYAEHLTTLATLMIL